MEDSKLATFDREIKTITERRGEVYGHPAKDFSIAADLMRHFDHVEPPALRHALRMICVKLARLATTPTHLDSYVDIVGYARTAVMVMDAAPTPAHASDCRLHDGPAFKPGPCSCGAEPGLTPEKYGERDFLDAQREDGLTAGWPVPPAPTCGKATYDAVAAIVTGKPEPSREQLTEDMVEFARTGGYPVKP